MSEMIFAIRVWDAKIPMENKILPYRYKTEANAQKRADVLAEEAYYTNGEWTKHFEVVKKKKKKKKK